MELPRNESPNGMLGQKGQFCKVLCGRCEFVIAHYQAGEVSIRFKEYYVFAMGGICVVNCRTCGHPNLVVDAEYEKLHPEVVKKARAVFHMSEGSIKPWVPKSEFEKQKH